MKPRVLIASLAVFAFARIANAQEPAPPPPQAPVSAPAPETPAPETPAPEVPAPAAEPIAEPAPHQDLPQVLDEAKTPKRDNEPRVTVKFEIAHGFMNLFGFAYDMNGGRVGIGLQVEHLSVYGIADLSAGSLPYGLSVGHGSLGVELLYRAFYFLRLGGGARLGYLQIDRATASSPMEALSFGGFLRVDLDVYSFGRRDDHSVFIGTRLNFDEYQGNGDSGPVGWGPEILAGFRY